MKDYNYKNDADNYDSKIKFYDSYLHDLLFGMSFEFVKKGEKLLDLGIGSGLSSSNFAKAGLRIFGIDNSEDMLQECGKKSIAEKLINVDLRVGEIPFDDNLFNHIICCGVLHFWGELDKIFSEASRLIKKGGIFSFTFMPNLTDDSYTELLSAWGVPVFKHSSKYIDQMQNDYGFRKLKMQRAATKGADGFSYNINFDAVVSKNI